MTATTTLFSVPALSLAGLGLGFGLLLGGCQQAGSPVPPETAGQSEPAAPASPLLGTAWHLVRMGETPVLAGSEVTLVFIESQRLAGSAGANRYFAGYKIDGEELKVQQAGSTKMFRDDPPGLMAQEDTFLKQLTEVKTWSHEEGGHLVLTTQDGTELHFATTPTEAPKAK